MMYFISLDKMMYGFIRPNRGIVNQNINMNVTSDATGSKED